MSTHQLSLFEERLLAKFLIYHKENPHLYDAFKKYTIYAIERGYKHFGAQMIIEKIRWETGVEARNSEFKISNDSAAFYARLFMLEHPSYANYFRTRPSVADKLTLEQLTS